MKLKECPLDPGGYFIINGSEKVILMQEQMSKNRIIVEGDTNKGTLVCSVTSSSAQTKSKTNIVMKDGRFFLQHNSFTADVPIIILIKAMGITSDKEILQYVGREENIWTNMVPSLKQCVDAKVSKIMSQVWSYNLFFWSSDCKWIPSLQCIPLFSRVAQMLHISGN